MTGETTFYNAVLLYIIYFNNYIADTFIIYNYIVKCRINTSVLIRLIRLASSLYNKTTLKAVHRTVSLYVHKQYLSKRTTYIIELYYGVSRLRLKYRLIKFWELPKSFDRDTLPKLRTINLSCYSKFLQGKNNFATIWIEVNFENLIACLQHLPTLFRAYCQNSEVRACVRSWGILPPYFFLQKKKFTRNIYYFFYNIYSSGLSS